MDAGPRSRLVNLEVAQRDEHKGSSRSRYLTANTSPGLALSVCLLIHELWRQLDLMISSGLS